MLRNILHLLRRLYELLWTLILTAVLGVATFVTWHFYQQERLQSQLQAGGQLVTVQVEHTDRTPRELWDALGNAVYLGFSYHNEPYETRWVNDTRWLSAGDRVALLYHPQLRVFGQPPQARIASETRVVSRLINWSVATSFDAETKALGLFGLVALGLFFIGGGLLASLTGWTLIQTLARSVLAVGLGAGALFFTYDTLHYYRYVAQLNRNGQLLDVVVLDTDRIAHGRKTRWYTYEAIFRFRNQERVIAIEAVDFERLNSKDAHLAVRHEAELNDFIAANYSAGFSEAFDPLFFWLFLFLTIRPAAARRAAAQPARN